MDAAAEPADEAGQALAAARLELVHAWEGYLGALQHFNTVGDAVAKLTGEEHLDALTAELSRIKQESARLKDVDLPENPSEEQVDELRNEASALKALVDGLAETQARLSEQLTGGFQQQSQSLQEELKELRRQRDEMAKGTAGQAGSALPRADQQRLRLEKERLAVRLAAVELALQNLRPDERQSQHAYDQNDRRLAALREQLTALWTRLSKLTEAQMRARVKKLEESGTLSGTESALRDLQLFRDRVLLQYFQDPERLRRMHGRLPRRTADLLKNRVDLAEAYWDRVLSSLNYRSGDELATLAERARKEKREFQTLAVSLRENLSRTLDELHELQAVREKAAPRLAVMADKVTASVKDMAERTQLETEITKERASFEEGMRTAVDTVERLSGRMQESAALMEEWVAALETVQQTLRWERLRRRDSGLWGARWGPAGADLAMLWHSPRPEEQPDAEAEAAQKLKQELFGERESTFTKSRRVWTKIRAGFSAVPVRTWVWTGIGVVLAAVAGVGIYHVARRRGVQLARVIVDQAETTEDEPHPISSGLSDRVNLMLLNMIGDLAIPLLVAAAFVFAVWQAVTEDIPRYLVGTFLGVLAAAGVTIRLVHHLFEAESPPHRPVPCADHVAWHYRRRLGALILFSTVVLLVPFLLGVAGVAPDLQSVFYEIHKTGFLVLLLLFLFRRERVLGLGDVGKAGWGMMVAWIAYPVLVLAVAALLVLQVIGYGVLVNYVGAGLLLTVGILIVIGAAVEYLNDWIDHYARDIPQPADESSVDAEVLSSGAELESRRSHYIITLLRWSVRFAGLTATVLLILRAWDVPVRATGVDWGRIGLGALAVLLALLLDRLVVTALRTLAATGRLPVSTVNILRRWGRGVLAIIVGLTLIAIAGVEIRSLWTIVATFLAMVAIGFFAVWSILSNLLATLVILIWRPFNVGEHLTVLPEGLEGQVVDINFMYTTLRAEDGAKVSIPNNLFAQKFIRRRAVRGRPKRTLAEQLEADAPLGE